MTDALLTLHSRWRQKARLFREHGHEATARAYEACSDDLEAALNDDTDDLLNLQEAARESGYSADHLGRLVREGKIPNAGRRNAPRVRRRDLPKRPEAAAPRHNDRPARQSAGISRTNDVSFQRIVREALVSKGR